MTPGIVGIALGAIALLVVLVIIARSRSRLGQRAIGYAALACYVTVLWVYALAPAPAVVSCREPNWFGFPNVVGVASGPRGLIADPAFQELVLNTALFVPLGVVLGVMLRWRFGVSVLVGLGLSLAVEATQLTGSWGLYPCAYRQFSTEDVLLNTLGTAAGAGIAWLAQHRPWAAAYIDPDSGRARSSGRRVLAIALDLLVVALAAVASIVFYRLVLTTGLERPFDLVNAGSDAILGLAIAVLGEAVVLVCTGMTVGEQIVDLRRRRR